MELAVFGTILIFVIGAIVRQALGSSYAQNQQLRAMRQAMKLSYKAGQKGEGARQTASITVIEDRLTAESGKHAAIERTPYVVGASATHNANLLMPITSTAETNLPVIDMIINGKQFALTLAKFKDVELARSCQNQSPCPAECNGNCSQDSFQFFPASSGIKWIKDCVKVTIELRVFLSCQNQSPCPAECNGDCSPSSLQSFTKITPSEETVGCAKLYDVVYNHKGYKKWCPIDPCPTPISNTGNLSADERFDLNRDGTHDVPPSEREKFYWQWFLVAGYNANYRPPYPLFTPHGQPPLPGPTIKTTELLMGEGIGIPLSDCSDNCKQAKNTFVDVDGDLKQESIMALTEDEYYNRSDWIDRSTGIIKNIRVMDMQEGDIDSTHVDSDPPPRPGLTNDTNMYASLRDGTYLLLEEGRLYKASCNPTSNPQDCAQFIRTVQKKDQVDVIERTIQLSNDTGRFCGTGGPVDLVSGQSNPVEACNSCFSSDNLRKTCMDRTKKLIYVRSRLKDRRGRKWITNVSGDAGVDFTVPKEK